MHLMKVVWEQKKEKPNLSEFYSEIKNTKNRKLISNWIGF